MTKKETETTVTKKKATTTKATVKAVKAKPSELEIKLAVEGYNAHTPTYAHDGDIGLDVYATKVEYDEDNDCYMCHTGLYMESEARVGCFLMCRSSNRRTDCYLANGVGLVEPELYRGEICFCFKSRTPITDIVDDKAFLDYINLPWYKKLFGGCTIYNKLWTNNYIDVMDDILGYAPYLPGDRMGQMVFLKDIPKVNFKIVKREELSKTSRGESGFGGSGR